METKDENRLLIVIDAHSLIHRAYHALPPLKTKDGRLVNAVYGFFTVFFKALRELRPDSVAVAFDLAAPTFRHRAFPGYKAKRERAPEEFYLQIPTIKEILGAFGVQIFEKQGFEADDIIGTIVTLAKDSPEFPDLKTIVLSSDNDVLQLVDEKVRALILKKGISQTTLYDEKAVREKYKGLSPGQLVDFKALRGDPSDNIPGVFGIGEKTATELLTSFQSLENLYSLIEQEATEELIKASVFEKLVSQKEQAFLSKKLAEICCNVKIDFNLGTCRWKDYDRLKVAEHFRDLQFFSLLSKLP
ncbi:MAG: 5'-3' exonuclease H3TH domain-containing protein [bacterium]|nr:5'-3' exonuclease H3TH domain-containing protein [bacterium]